MERISPWQILVCHFSTLRNYKTGKPSVIDYIIQVFVPIMVGVAIAVFGWKLPDPSFLAGVIATIAALLCAAAVFLFQVRLSINEHRDATRDRDVDLVDETFYNVMWTVLVGLAIAAIIVVGVSVGSDMLGPILSGIVVALALNFAFVIAMVLRRLHRAYDVVAAHRNL